MANKSNFIYKIYTDGASKGNPGVSGAGGVIYLNNVIVDEIKS